MKLASDICLLERAESGTWAPLTWPWGDVKKDSQCFCFRLVQDESQIGTACYGFSGNRVTDALPLNDVVAAHRIRLPWPARVVGGLDDGDGSTAGQGDKAQVSPSQLAAWCPEVASCLSSCAEGLRSSSRRPVAFGRRGADPPLRMSPTASKDAALTQVVQKLPDFGR